MVILSYGTLHILEKVFKLDKVDRLSDELGEKMHKVLIKKTHLMEHNVLDSVRKYFVPHLKEALLK